MNLYTKWKKQIFDPLGRGNTADTVNGCQMMSYFYVEKDLNSNEHLNLGLEYNSSFNVACFSQNNFYFFQNKLRA